MAEIFNIFKPRFVFLRCYFIIGNITLEKIKKKEISTPKIEKLKKKSLLLRSNVYSIKIMCS